MNTDKERKFFKTGLWIFLSGTVLFYIGWISAGRIDLPSPVWLMLLLLDLGFIFFLFVPMPGRHERGPGGRSVRRIGWYPQTLSEIVEVPEEGRAGTRSGMLEPGTVIRPVPLISLILLIPVILMSVPFGGDPADRGDEEIARLAEIYSEARAELKKVERLALDAGIAERRILAGKSGAQEDLAWRMRLIERTDSLATVLGRDHRPFR
ncbi:MAG TPA: hypothetical protein VLA34_13745, partial [Candidatus Krumholzibacterium sp.]|nr:hypothetical protein [Candidatus Krumholzibacterium sp.]